MKIKQSEISGWIGAESLGDDVLDLEISGIEQSVTFGELRYVLTFADDERQVRLNTASLRSLVEGFGDETDAWHGKRVGISTRTVMVSGRQQLALVVEPLDAEPEPAPTRPAAAGKRGKSKIPY